MRRSTLTALLAAAALLPAARAAATSQGKALLYGGAGQGKVIFDGRLHASKGLLCADCHTSPARFATRKQARITMDDHASDRACFGCHDGGRAFADCDGCHRKLDAPKPPAARPVRLHGAASTVENLVAPSRARVEQATGLALEVEKSNAGKGLVDLLEGRCDAALASASLEATVQAARQAGYQGQIPGDLQLHVVKSSEVVFVVHPSNPVKKLTSKQLADVHTGAVSSWKELGGKDQPIVVYTDALASATRGLVKQVVLGGKEYARGAVAVEKVAQVNERVAADPAGIGALGREFAGAGTAVVDAPRVERPLALVTRGAPTPEVQKVIEALRAAAR